MTGNEIAALVIGVLAVVAGLLGLGFCWGYFVRQREDDRILNRRRAWTDRAVQTMTSGQQIIAGLRERCGQLEDEKRLLQIIAAEAQEQLPKSPVMADEFGAFRPQKATDRAAADPEAGAEISEEHAALDARTLVAVGHTAPD